MYLIESDSTRKVVGYGHWPRKLNLINGGADLDRRGRGVSPLRIADQCYFPVAEGGGCGGDA